MEVNQESFTDPWSENLDIKLEDIEDESLGTNIDYIKTEEVSIKDELEEDGLSSSSSGRQEMVTFRYLVDEKVPQSNKHISCGYINDRSQIRNFKCTTCDYATYVSSNIKKHVLKHLEPCISKSNEGSSETNSCVYVKDSSNPQRYKCVTCTKVSQDSIEDPINYILIKLDGKMVYKCGDCDYTTDKRRTLNHHSLVHKNASGSGYKRRGTEEHTPAVHKRKVRVVKIYICEECLFQTEDEDVFTQHRSVHEKKPDIKSETPVSSSYLNNQMLKCSTCNFETTHGIYLSKHMLLHINQPEKELYDIKTDSTSS